MITAVASAKDTYKPLVTIWGLSTETKPIEKYGSLKMANGSWYYEQDTSTKFRYDEKGKVWYEQKNYIYADDGNPSKTELVGLSTDERPINTFGSGIKIQDGAVLYLMDTSEKCRYDRETASWHIQTPISTGGGGSGIDIHADGESIIINT